MGNPRLPIKLLSCPSHISRFVSFVQKWLLSPGLTKGREKRHLFHKHKEPLWRHSPLFTFKHSFWCQLRSIEICLHWLFKKKFTQVAERQNKPLSNTAAIVYASRIQWQTVGTHPKRKRMGAKMVMGPAHAGGELRLLVLLPVHVLLHQLWMPVLDNSCPSPLQWWNGLFSIFQLYSV